MTKSHWRRKAREVISKVLKECEGQDESAIRKALREAYPFGPRSHHPYKIWLDEQRKRLFYDCGIGVEPPKKQKPTPEPEPEVEGQQKLF